MTFANTDDLRVELGLSAFTTDQETRAQRRLDAATGAIQRYTRQTIEHVSGDVAVLVGTWSAGLVLPELPVTAVTSVVIDGDTLTSGTDYVFDGQRTLWRGSTAFSWGGPETKITVTYSHGFDPLPPEVSQICVTAAARGWSTPSGEKQVSIGSWSASYGTESNGVTLTSLEKSTLRELRRKWAP